MGIISPPAMSENQNKYEGKQCEQFKKTAAKTDLFIPHDKKLNVVGTPVKTSFEV